LLHKHLQGLNIGHGKRKVTSVAYADDVTVILTNQKDTQTLKPILTIHEKATGATINWAKSSALPIGRWDATQDTGEVRYKEDTKNLRNLFRYDDW
jgi:hypothetical protein